MGADSRTTKELIDQCGGVLYRQGDISDLTKRIDYICQNKETLIETVRLAQKKAKSIFAAERNAKDIYEVYKEILA